MTSLATIRAISESKGWLCDLVVIAARIASSETGFPTRTRPGQREDHQQQLEGGDDLGQEVRG